MLRRGALLLRQRCGILGLPNVGKSTFFNVVTGQDGETGNRPFVTIKPNTGNAVIRDPRLQELCKLSPHRKAKPICTDVQIWDIAGLVKGAGKGEGLGNQFLQNIRECQALLHMVRCYDNDEIVHMDGSVDPLRDIAVINNELIVADLQSLQKQSDKSKSPLHKRVFEMCVETLMNERMLFTLEDDVSAEEWEVIRGASLLSAKEMLFVCNVDEEGAAAGTNEHVDRVRERYGDRHKVCVVSASIEEEVMRMDEQEGPALLEEFGIAKSMAPPVLTAVMDALHQATFFTAGPKEVRAWTFKKGSSARDASAAIHSDFPYKLTKVDAAPFDTFVAADGNEKVMTSQQVSYEMQDGDVVYFHIDQAIKVKKNTPPKK